ncbi:hypothetical protein BLOT_006724 [Blomia tropicalis]|nr:hypothetical protein BLOT_006724 [Blomia tropicalis]
MSEELGTGKTLFKFQKKIDNLKQLYKNYKPGPSGSSPSTWKFFYAVHEILHTSHYFNPTNIEVCDSFDAEEVSSQSRTPTSRRSKKRSLENVLNDFHKRIKEENQEYEEELRSRLDKMENRQALLLNEISNMRQLMEKSKRQKVNY